MLNNLQETKELILKAKERGYSEEEIKAYLKNIDCPQNLVDQAFNLETANSIDSENVKPQGKEVHSNLKNIFSPIPKPGIYGFFIGFPLIVISAIFFISLFSGNSIDNALNGIQNPQEELPSEIEYIDFELEEKNNTSDTEFFDNETSSNSTNTSSNTTNQTIIPPIILGGGSGGGGSSSSTPSIPEEVDDDTPINETIPENDTPSEDYEIGNMSFGTTITQEHWILNNSDGSAFVNIHVYGWGSLWPFELDGEEGEFDNGTVYANRVSLALVDNQEPVLTACCVPSNLSTGGAWELDDSRVLSGMEETYASRIVDLLERHPEIRKVIVWNEFKGYWNSDLQRWDHEEYLILYNAVYDAVKAHDSDIMVGGGYIVFSRKGHGYDQDYGGFVTDSRDMDALLGWAEGANGYDAVVLDGWLDEGEFAAVHTWAINVFNVSIWWSEFYGRNITMSQAADELASVGRDEDIAFFWAEDTYAPFIVPGANQTVEQQIILGPQAVESGNISNGTHFASPEGTGSDCTIEIPCTIQTAISQASAGSHIFLRGGTYNLTSQISISITATAENPLIIESYPGERAVIDGQNNENTRIALWQQAQHVTLRNINVTRMAVAGVYIQGTNNTIDGVNTYNNRYSGIQIFSDYELFPYGAKGSYNTIRNCISHSNSDEGYAANGGDADGIGISSGESNSIMNCLVYNNSDDGIDSWRATNSFIAFNIVHSNGLADGDGNGVKAGGTSPSNGTVVMHTISYGNRAIGFDFNSGENVSFYYLTSYDNQRSFYTGISTILQNSIAAGTGSNLSFGDGTFTNNSWQIGGEVEFISIDNSSENFLRLYENSSFYNMGAYALSPYLNYTSKYNFTE